VTVFLQDEFIRSSLFSVEGLGWEASNSKLQSSTLRSSLRRAKAASAAERHNAEEGCESAATAEDGPEKFQAPNLNAPPWIATTSLGRWFAA